MPSNFTIFKLEPSSNRYIKMLGALQTSVRLQRFRGSRERKTFIYIDIANSSDAIKNMFTSVFLDVNYETVKERIEAFDDYFAESNVDLVIIDKHNSEMSLEVTDLFVLCPSDELSLEEVFVCDLNHCLKRGMINGDYSPNDFVIECNALDVSVTYY